MDVARFASQGAHFYPYSKIFYVIIKRSIHAENPPLSLDFFCVASLQHGNQIALPFADGFFFLSSLL